ncbi:MAG: hypothetical protein M3O28_01880 [Actinomycetota bacterium]|nr:hypothetical protein [Actinomycetota bacterium]
MPFNVESFVANVLAGKKLDDLAAASGISRSTGGTISDNTITGGSTITGNAPTFTVIGNHR